jgi:hypothetical protein
MNVSCRTIDVEAFVFAQETRLLLKLDKVGSIIWYQINGTKTIEEICDNCYLTFSGDREEIQGAVREFIVDLHEKKVVVLSVEPFGEEMISAC